MKTSFLHLIRKQKAIARAKERKNSHGTENADTCTPPTPPKEAGPQCPAKQEHVPAASFAGRADPITKPDMADKSAKKYQERKAALGRFRLSPRKPLGSTGVVGTLASIRYIPNWISVQEEKVLMQSIYAEAHGWKQLSNRRLQVA